MSTKSNSLTVHANLVHNGTSKTVPVNFSKQGIQIFFNARHIYLTISSQERCWFEFLCERAGKYGRVSVGGNEEEAFYEQALKITDGKAKVIKTLNNYTRKLVEKGLLLKTKDSGLYYINPKYVQLTTQSDRVKALEFLFEEGRVGGIEVQKLLNKPLEDIFEDIPPPF